MTLSKCLKVMLLGCAVGLMLATVVTAEKPALKDPIADMQKNASKGKLSKRDVAKAKLAIEKGAAAAKRRYPKNEKDNPAADMALGKDNVDKLKRLKDEKQHREAHSKLLKSNAVRQNLEKAQEVGRGKPKDAKSEDKRPW